MIKIKLKNLICLNSAKCATLIWVLSHFSYLCSPVPVHQAYPEPNARSLLLPGYRSTWSLLSTRLSNQVLLMTWCQDDPVAHKYTYLIGVQSTITHVGDGAGLWATLCLPKKPSFSIFQSLPHFPSLQRNDMSGQSLPWLYGHPPWVCSYFEVKLL